MDPKIRNYTGIVLLTLLLGLLGWDVWLAVDGVDGNTISEVMGETVVAGFLVAYLAGHWWPMRKVLAGMWKQDLAALSDQQLRDVRLEVDRLLASRERG